MKTIATHDGRFHTDEVFAIAILKLVYPKVKIIRTRKPEEFKKADFKIDIGKKYNPKSGEFDHHQETFNEIRKNKIPYASAGLVWKYFREKLINSKKAFVYIDEKLIQPIDAMDCGLNIILKEIIHNYGIGQVINSFKPVWNEKNKDRDKAFEEAVKFATGLLSREIKYANGIKKAEEIVKKAISKSNKDYIVLEQNIPWEEYIIKNTKLIYVVQKNSGGFWNVYTVRINLNSFENRKSLPKKWAGLQGENLAKATGIKDAFSCHKNRFTIVAKSKESAIKLAQLALEEKD